MGRTDMKISRIVAIIGITYDLKGDWKPSGNDPEDMNAEFDKPETLELIVSALESGGHCVKRIGNVDDLIEQMDDLDVDIVFNATEGLPADLRSQTTKTNAQGQYELTEIYPAEYIVMVQRYDYVVEDAPADGGVSMTRMSNCFDSMYSAILSPAA